MYVLRNDDGRGVLEAQSQMKDPVRSTSSGYYQIIITFCGFKKRQNNLLNNLKSGYYRPLFMNPASRSGASWSCSIKKRKPLPG